MKRFILLLIISVAAFTRLYAQPNTEDILNLLVNDSLISKDRVDSLRAELALEQQKNPKDKLFTIDLDFRPRSELRNGYGQLRTDTTRPAVFTNQRMRLIFGFKHEGKFAFQTSIQDIRMWGDKDPRSNNGSVQIFEAWAEPYFTPQLSLRMGRQKLAFDNQRLFAENDWRPNSGTHDAFNLRYNGVKLSSDLALAWNSNPTVNASNASGNLVERFFDNPYNNASPYKGMAVNYLKYLANERWIFSAINVADAFKSTKIGDDKEQLYLRFTNGGRIEFQKGKWYVTGSGYLQSGWLASGKKVTAWFLQPEIKYTSDRLIVRLGVEVFSGDNGKKKSNVDKNFVALYGVAHRFNGNMDFFTRFPNDLNNAGLINPYLFFLQPFSKKLELKNDFHLFYSSNNYVMTKTTEDHAIGETINKYLGFEHDILLIYKPNAYSRIEWGWSYALPTVAMKEILSKAKGYGRAGLFPTWWYLSFSFRPQLLKLKF